MKYVLKITDEATELLYSAAKWYAKTSQSLEIATAWYDGFLDELELLEENPMRGSVAPENDLFDFELREILLRKRKAYYAPSAVSYHWQHD